MVSARSENLPRFGDLGVVVYRTQLAWRRGGRRGEREERREGGERRRGGRRGEREEGREGGEEGGQTHV